MGTNAKSDPSWIDRLKTRGTLALSTVAAALGLGLLNTSPPAPSPTPSSRAAQAAQDPVSPDGHYVTFGAYLDSVKCKLERGGYTPATRSVCSPLFAVAANSQTSQDFALPASHVTQRADQRLQNNSQTSDINNNYASDVLKIVNITTSGTLREAERAFSELSNRLGREQITPEQKNYILSFFGGDAGYQKAYDQILEGQANWYKYQFNPMEDLSTFNPQKLCDTFQAMYSYRNLLGARKHLRESSKIKDEKQPSLEEEERFYSDRIGKIGSIIGERKISCDQFERYDVP